MKLHIKTQDFKKGIKTWLQRDLSTVGTRRQSDRQQDNSTRVTQKGHTDSFSSQDQLSTLNNKELKFWLKAFQHFLVSANGKIQTKGFINMAEESKTSLRAKGLFTLVNDVSNIATCRASKYYYRLKTFYHLILTGIHFLTTGRHDLN